MQRSPDAHALLDRLDPDAPLAQRHLWLMAVLDWVRGDRLSAADRLQARGHDAMAEAMRKA